jgi:N-acetylglutamate synthase-like GNAT family acetyltransferase
MEPIPGILKSRMDNRSFYAGGERTNEEVNRNSVRLYKHWKFTENDQIFCLCFNCKRKLYLGMLTVSPQLQNGGIGAQLLAQADLHAKQLGFLK